MKILTGAKSSSQPTEGNRLEDSAAVKASTIVGGSEVPTSFVSVEAGKENPDFKGFKKKGIEPQLNDLMWQMFGGIVATGENAWAPSSGVLPSGVLMGDDTPNEGFGDSDENSNENESILSNEVPSNPPRETPNRRKETLGVVHGKGKKIKFK
ncbi:hypothetical protein PVK06_035926 [Gossypium arboreum]|uniref:Uncharacterized protein n=1 Tax=Gossypium arboreum TaxID=29729 RepID=A0ABR0NJ22_GOSAR|nr:hypothetical protein PVK06_035926 [Gossypium arboreum]